MKSTAELREMSIDELNNELISMRTEAFKLRIKKSNSMLEQTHVIKNTRRTIARIKTIMTEKAGNGHD